VDVKPVPDPALTRLAKVPVDTVITLKRSACHGRCPVYDVAIDAQGNVRFNGVAHVAQYGEKKRRVPPAAVLALLRRFGQVGYLSIDEAKMRATCPHTHTDAPSVKTSLTVGGKSNEVSNYKGCPQRTLRKALAALEREIDRVAVPTSWLKPVKKRPKGAGSSGGSWGL
jgi:hypothetical protein